MTFNGMKNSALVIFGLCGSWIAWFLGGWDSAMQTLLIIMTADYLSGLAVAGIFQKSGKSEGGALDSRAGFAGLMKKVAILLAVFVGAALDRSLGGTELVRDTIILFFTANEGLSIIENLGLMGVPFPPKLKAALEQLKSKDDMKY